MPLPSCRRALLAGVVDLEVDDGGNIEASDKEAAARVSQSSVWLVKRRQSVQRGER